MALAEPLELREVAPGAYLHEGVHEEMSAGNQAGIANIGFIVGEEAVAVIDSGGTAAQGRRLRAAIRRVTNLPIRYVVNTHVHPDHIFGNASFLGDRPAFVGHAKLRRAVAARGAFYLDRLKEELGAVAADTEVVPPSLLVEDQLLLDLGNRRLRVTAHGTAHTDNDLTVYDEATRTWWLGDLLFVERIPVVDGSLKGWLAVMAELRGRSPARVVPGHGPVVADLAPALDAQGRYLRSLLEEIRAVIRAGGTMEQAVARVGQAERAQWRLFDDYHARNVVTAFSELEWE